jgi:hypothetical protein
MPFGLLTILPLSHGIPPPVEPGLAGKSANSWSFFLKTSVLATRYPDLRDHAARRPWTRRSRDRARRKRLSAKPQYFTAA